MKNTSIIKVAILPSLGTFETETSENGKVSVVGGYEFELMKIIFQCLQLSYEILIPKVLEWGVLRKDGTWTGLIGYLNKSEADMAIGAMYLTETRTEAADYSYPYKLDNMFFVTRKPEKFYPSFTLLNPFTTSLWLSILISLVFLIVTCRYLLSRKYSWQIIYFDILRYILKQPMKIQDTSVSGRLLLATILVSALLFSLSYSSVLFSFFAIPMNEKEIKDIHSLVNLVKTKEIKVYITGGKSIHQILAGHQSDPDIQFLVASINKNKWILDAEPDILKKYIIKERNALITTQNLLQNMSSHKNVLISKDHFQLFPQCIMLRKGFKYKEKINQVIHQISASGIYQKKVADYFFQTERHSKLFGSNTENKLTLTKLKGAFIILLIGYVLSLLTLLIELLNFVSS